MASGDGMDLELQKAVVAALLGDAGFMQLIGAAGNLYQDVAPNPTFPYVVIGDTHSTDQSVELLASSEIYSDIHVWSRADPGFVECKRLTDAVRRVLHDANLVLDTQRCVLIQHRITRHMRDPDGVTKHGVVTMYALTEVTS